MVFCKFTKRQCIEGLISPVSQTGKKIKEKFKRTTVNLQHPSRQISFLVDSALSKDLHLTGFYLTLDMTINYEDGFHST